MIKLKKYLGLIAGIITLLITLIFKTFPTLTESIYGIGIYPVIRNLFDFTLALFPFSLLLLFIVFVLISFFLSAKRNGFRGVLNLLGWLIFAFYWMWGFNYFRPALSEKLGIEIKPIDFNQREILIQTTIDQAVKLSKQIIEKPPQSTPGFKKQITSACKKLSADITGITPAKSTPVAMFPSSLFLRIGITGMYFPFTGQAHYEPLLGNISYPFTVAHEWFHAAGIASESEANFLAYISLINSNKDELIYAAKMNLLIELLIYYKLTDSDKFLFYKNQFTPKMDSDLKRRNALYQKYSNVVSQQSDVVINQYLHMQNQAGVSEYRRLADWVVAFKTKKY